MRRRGPGGWSIGPLRIAAVLCLLALAVVPVRAEDLPCSVPDGLAFSGFPLPRSKAAIDAGKRLVVLVVGGASMGGLAAGGHAYSVPMRLEARLRAALPGKDIAVVTRSVEGGTHATVGQMPALIHDTGASLVVWETGSRAAVAGDDVETFASDVEAGIDAAKGAKADIILMDLQYAPSIARVMNQTPYSNAIRGAAEMEEVPMLHRSDLMRAWSDSGELDLDASDPAKRVQVARKLYDCLAAMLATGIAGALHGT